MNLNYELKQKEENMSAGGGGGANSEAFEQMKARLKEALDDKRDFEIEYLQLQKNYLRTKNALAEAQK